MTPPPPRAGALVGAALLLGAAVAAGLLLARLAPAAWYAPPALVALAAAVAWWGWLRAERARAAEARQASGDLARAARRADEQARAHATAVARWQATLDATPLPVIALDADGGVAFANGAMADLLGRPAPALARRPAEELLVQAEVRALLTRAFRGEPARGRVRFLEEDGARYFEATAQPLPRPDAGPAGTAASHPVVLTLLDVTDLATADQLKTDFAANASHELRTPIAAIKGAVETLGLAGDDPAMTARLRGMIAQHAERLQDLVDDLLDLSRLESAEGRPEAAPVRLPDLAAGLADLFAQRCAERRTPLEFDLDPALHVMRTDARLLELVLRNLIDNALKFAREGTPVRVVARAAAVEPAPDAPDAPAPGTRALLTGARFRVIDRGAGIPLEHQQRIFERFYQVDPSRDGQARRRGTGLGLAIVKHALRRLGGRVSVESVWQQGTTMTFEIPHCVETAPRA